MLFRSISICTILLFTGVKLSAQKYIISAHFEGMQVPEKLELLDDTYNWTTIGRSTMALYFLGVERKTSSHLSFGLSINYSNLSTVLYYHPDWPKPGFAYHRRFNINYMGLRLFTKYIKTRKSIDFYWKSSLTYYRHLYSKSHNEENGILLSSQSLENDAIKNNALYTTTELGITFPMSPKNRKVSLQGEFGLQVNIPILDFLENDSKRLLYQGVHLGVNLVFQ